MVILKVLAIILSHFHLGCGPDSVFLAIISPIFIGLKRYFSQIIPRPFKISLFHYHIDCGPVSTKIGITFQIFDWFPTGHSSIIPISIYYWLFTWFGECGIIKTYIWISSGFLSYIGVSVGVINNCPTSIFLSYDSSIFWPAWKQASILSYLQVPKTLSLLSSQSFNKASREVPGPLNVLVGPS